MKSFLLHQRDTMDIGPDYYFVNVVAQAKRHDPNCFVENLYEREEFDVANHHFNVTDSIEKVSEIHGFMTVVSWNYPLFLVLYQRKDRRILKYQKIKRDTDMHYQPPRKKRP